MGELVQPVEVSTDIGRVGSPADRGGAASSRTTNAATSNTYQITINAPSGDAEDIRASFEAWLTRSLEATALQVGGGEVPA
jgi:hypothetical protein